MNILSPSDEGEFKRAKPFKLCFVTKREPGRSHITIGKQLTLAPIITPKFYIKNNYHPDNLETHVKRLIVTGPKEKLNNPQTENQRYGWYECGEVNDSKLNFRITASQLVKEHLMIYEKIRE